MSEKLAEQITEKMELIAFYPSDAMCDTKAKLMAMLSDNPMYSLEDMTLQAAISLTKEKRLKIWWEQDGFLDWFRNRNEFREEVEALITKGLKCINRLFTDDNPKLAAAQVNALKVLLEIGKRYPKQYAVVAQPGSLSLDQLDPAQFDDLLRKAGYVKMEQTPPHLLEVETVKEDSDE